MAPLWASGAELYDPPSVYLTWQRSPETTMTIQWLTKPTRLDDTVEYHAASETEWRTAKGNHYLLPEKMPYLLHRVELTGLLPDTMYEFRPGSDAVIFKFKTMPAKLNGPIRFVIGGDVYHDDLHTLGKMNRKAAGTNPHFALVGGDLTYAEDTFVFFKFLGIFKDRSVRWMEWLKAWKKQMVAPDGRLIPMIPAIGNHDTHGRFGQTPAQAQCFTLFFPCRACKATTSWILAII
jgi:acid phosphatase type 7